ncbi:hypothetical protein Tco_1447385 [Tanacetum coccineum]
MTPHQFSTPSHRVDISESFAALAATKQSRPILAQGSIDRFEVALEETDERVADLSTRYRQIAYTRDACSFAMDRIRELQHQRQVSDNRMTRFGERVRGLERQDGPPDTGSSSLAAPYTNRNSRNLQNSDSNSTGGGERTTRNCTYKDFLNSQPLNSKGTEGAVELAHWFEKMEFVFHISNSTVEYQVKYATCTLLGSILTWWNSHVRAVGHDATYGMPWKTLMKMMTEAYYPRSEIKKLEIEL